MDRLTLPASVLRGTGTGVWMLARTARGLGRRIVAGDPLVAPMLAADLARFMWGPVPTLLALALLIGVIVGIAAARVLALWSAELVILSALVDAMLRHLLPMLIGVFASSAVAVTVATRLGAMRLAREIDALEAMGHDPVPHTLGTPLLAVVAAGPVHMILVGLAALLGAGVPLHLSANLGWTALTRFAYSDVAARAMALGVLKATVFGLLAFAVGAAVGLRPVATAADMSRLGARAFTIGLLAVFAVAALWTALA